MKVENERKVQEGLRTLVKSRLNQTRESLSNIQEPVDLRFMRDTRLIISTFRKYFSPKNIKELERSYEELARKLSGEVERLSPYNQPTKWVLTQ